MYQRHARRQGWTFDVCDTRESDAGVRQVTVEVRGAGAGALAAEGGAHSVQHITRSRRKDRIHTSTVTVAVLPIPAGRTVDWERRLKGEVRCDTFRGSGAGGQHRNVTDSAVRLVHEPTSETVTVTSGRSQHENRDRALRVLIARLDAAHTQQQADGRQRQRREQTRAERARAVRVYDLVRDMVRCADGRKVRGVKRIMDGHLDELLS